MYFNDIIRTSLFGIYVYFMGFFSSQKDKFLNHKMLTRLSAGRPMSGRPRQSRSTGLVDRRAQDVHAARAGGPVDRAVDRRHDGQKFDHWVGRPEEQFCPFQLPMGRFELGL